MGRDEFQYFQIPFDQFTKHFVQKKTAEPPKHLQNVGGRKSSHTRGQVAAMSEQPEALCFMLNNVLGECKSRFQVIPRTSDTKEFTPTLALFNKPEKVTPQSCWAWITYPVHTVRDEASAGFHFSPSNGRVWDTPDKKPPFLVDTTEGDHARRQLEECISEMLLHQHRIHVFMLHITKSSARVSRWDRAGCIVSEPIDLTSRLFEFQHFVYRLAHLPPLLQGYDDTVKLATKQQIQQLKSYKPKGNQYLMEHRTKMLDSAEEYPIYEVTCPDQSNDLADMMALAKLRSGAPQQSMYGEEDSDADDEAGLFRMNMPKALDAKPRKFLIGRPVTDRRPLAGRATVGYVVYDLQERRMSFLKDQWRMHDELRSEIDTYKHLRSRSVLVARLDAGGDIPHHRTRSQEIMHGLPWSMKSVDRVHVRVVTKNVGRPLETAGSGAELLRYISCARHVHESAWRLAGVLHNDISLGNILIDVESDDAFLNDWDVAVYRSYVKQKSERDGFSGTWAYASALTLQYPKKPIEVEDDVEAFIWLIVYLAMRFLKHNLSTDVPGAPNPELNDLMQKLFYEEEENEYGECIGGKTKLFYIRTGCPPVQLANRRSPVAVFLDEAFKLLQQVYSKVTYASIEHWRGAPAGPGSYSPGRYDKSLLDGLNHVVLNKMLYDAYMSVQSAPPSEPKPSRSGGRPMPDLV